ncbi:MAG: hypothetical protein WBQ18_14590 [Solirubrobacteraceae bacterium]|jgi:hypothetical protein
MWPAFVATALADGLIAYVRPFVGDRQSFAGGVLGGLILNLLAVLLLSRPFGRLLRRRADGLPSVVAANYGGTLAVGLVSVALLAIGLVRHDSLVDTQRVLSDAIVRAEAYIGDHAPAEFRVNVAHPDTYTIQTGSRYRVCVPSRYRPRYYCVIVKPALPLAQSVTYAGSEPNWTLATGTD